MRVTNQMLHDSSVRMIQSAYGKLAAATRAVSSGQALSAPSDDPVASARILDADAKLRSLDIHDGAAKSVQTRFDAADANLGAVGDLLITAKQLAVEASSGAHTQADYTAYSKQLETIRQQVLSFANAKVSGKYVFGGRTDAVAPFDDFGLFVGDTGERLVEVEDGVMLPATASAAEAFTSAGGGIDVILALDNLKAAAETGNVAGIQTGIDTMTKSVEQVNSVRTSVGGVLNRAEQALSDNDMLRVLLKAWRSRSADVDMASAASDLSTAQGLLDAALASAKAASTFSVSKLIG